MGLELIILIIYGLALLFIFLYSLIQIQLVYHYLKSKRASQVKVEPIQDPSEWPFVTVQLPVFNEKYVIERLIRNACKLDYPKDKFEIQVLDDSTDETTQIVEALCREFTNEGIAIELVRRDEREGFKAGALAHGLKVAKGNLLAIFDADFIPSTDFLKRTVPYFIDDEVGMVQTKWEHINENYSWLTRLQAFGLDAHFTVEQGGRNSGGHFINFNGTAGLWRKECIEDAGGWQADTLTEDLDLSYRAQMKGWKFKYLEECKSPAELPAEMNALKTQQYRWTKGAAECTRKNLWNVLKSGGFGLSTKMNAIFHLLNSSLFICIVIISILSIPILFIKHEYVQYDILYNIAGFFLLGVLFLSIFYYTAFTRKFSRSFKSFFIFIVRFPFFLSVSMGLALHNGLAAFEGLIGKKTPFVRTPKFNIVNKKDVWKSNQYLSGKIGRLTYLEILLVFYFLGGLIFSFVLGDFGLFPFLLMLTFGYAFVAFLSIKHALS